MPQITTCATCPLSRQIEGNRYECTSSHAGTVVRGHWEATNDCTDAIEAHRLKLEASIVDADNQYLSGKIAGFWDAKHKTNTRLDTDGEWLEGYWVGFDEYLNTLKVAVTPVHHLQITYHVPSDLYVVKNQGRTVYQGRKLPAMPGIAGMEVQKIYR